MGHHFYEFILCKVPKVTGRVVEKKLVMIFLAIILKLKENNNILSYRCKAAKTNKTGIN